MESNILRCLDKSGFILSRSWVEIGDFLVGNLTSQKAKESLHAPEGKLLQGIFGIQVDIIGTCFKIPMGGKGQVIDVKWIYHKDTSINHEKGTCLYFIKMKNTNR